MTPTGGSRHAVLFDFDGTLAVLQIDFPEMKRRVHGLTRRYAPEFDLVDSLWTLELIEAVTLHLSEHRREGAAQFRVAALAAVEEVEMNAARDCRWLQGARAAVTALRERGVRVGVVTRNCRRAVEFVSGPAPEWCDGLFTRDEVTRVKPHPEHLLVALRTLAVEPARALMVGDHASDIIVARAAGLDSVGVLTGNATRAALLEAGARHVLNSVAELPALLASGDHQDLARTLRASDDHETQRPHGHPDSRPAT